MHNQSSLDLLVNELLRRGLPRKYVRRVVQELVEHREDILDERRAAGDGSGEQTVVSDRLGDLTALADVIVSEYRASTFCGRHPVLTFVVAPVPLVILAWFGIVLFFAVLGWVGDLVGVSACIEGKPITQWPVVAVWCLLSFYYVLMFAPYALVGAGLCRLAISDLSDLALIVQIAFTRLFVGSSEQSIRTIPLFEEKR